MEEVNTIKPIVKQEGANPKCKFVTALSCIKSSINRYINLYKWRPKSWSIQCDSLTQILRGQVFLYLTNNENEKSTVKLMPTYSWSQAPACIVHLAPSQLHICGMFEFLWKKNNTNFVNKQSKWVGSLSIGGLIKIATRKLKTGSTCHTSS